jgi:hypothetical protein
LLLVGATNIYAADYYIAQNAAGNNDATSCTAAKAYSWNWKTPNVVAGDTVHLCGTFTSTLIIPQSSRSPGVTVKFENGAKFSKSAWGTKSSAAIYAINKNYISIDGNNVGIIENTDNGTDLGTQLDSEGIYISSGSNIVIKNLNIKELYNRIPRVAGDSNKYGRGIVIHNSSSVTINNNTIYGVYYGIQNSASSGNPSGLRIHHNDISQMSTGIVVRQDGATNYSNVNIYNNKIYDSYVWDGCWSGTGDDQCTGGKWNHRDGIHTWGNYSGYTLGPINIYNNEFFGDWGVSAHITAYVYLTDYTYPAYIYNNLMVATVAPPSNAFIDLGTYGTGSAYIYNNTIKSTSNTNTGGTAIYFANAGAWTADIRNNIISTTYMGIYDPGGIATITADYNNYYNVHTVGRRSVWYDELTKWQTSLGGCPVSDNECNSITSNPQLTASYALPLGSPAIDAGTDLSAIFTTDILGYTRQNPWDIGAYDYAADAGITQYALSVTSANGTVTINPSGIICRSACSANFSSGVSVILTAQANSGYKFSGWSGACSGTGTCSVIMTVAKSVIATFVPIPITNSAIAGDGGGSGRCFIATTAYGSYLDSNVVLLRDFRDRILLKNKLGKKFVEFYYKHSPPIANTITKYEILRIATRLALTPIVYILAYPNITLILLLIPLLILVVSRRKECPHSKG